MSRELISHSKFLSLVLRHRPETIGLTLDANGWANVDELLRRAAAHGRRLDRATLDRIVRENDKQRFAFSDDGLRIRASQGHSIHVDLDLQPIQPPTVLYHGTAHRFMDAIRVQGLISMQRRHVHLTADVKVAEEVGKRHGKPAILVVHAEAMFADGCQFYLSENGVWLTASVPPEYLEFPE
jgi:putative RNA 2'-phosphotransferase